MDRGEAFVEVKGSVLPFCAKRLYITSNDPVQDWYEKCQKENHYAAITRRIDFFWNGTFINENQVPWMTFGSMEEPVNGPLCKYLGHGRWDVDLYPEIEIEED